MKARGLIVATGVGPLSAALMMGCYEPDRAATPESFPLHARIDDSDQHGRGWLSLPLDEVGASPPSFTFYPERMGLVHGSPPTSVVLAGDLRILPGAGRDDLVFRPGEHADASIVTYASGAREIIPVSDFVLELDGNTLAVTGSVTSPFADTFDLWGNLSVICASGEDARWVTETGEVRSIRCGDQ